MNASTGGSGFGYSAFWFARALGPGGSVTLTDAEPDNLERARAYLGRAGLVDRCRFEPAGDALEVLARADGRLDIVYIDVEKREYPRALALALPKLRPGGLVLAQGVLWGGAVARGETDPSSAALREFLRIAFGSEGLVTTILPVGDGLSVTLKR